MKNIHKNNKVDRHNENVFEMLVKLMKTASYLIDAALNCPI